MSRSSKAKKKSMFKQFQQFTKKYQFKQLKQLEQHLRSLKSVECFKKHLKNGKVKTLTLCARTFSGIVSHHALAGSLRLIARQPDATDWTLRKGDSAQEGVSSLRCLPKP